MSEQAETGAQQEHGQFTQSLERVWGEIKQISKQVQQETRRSGRIARLRLDLRSLRREVFEVRARLGKAVYEARNAGGDDTRLSEVPGFAGGVSALDALHEKIRAAEQQVLRLQGPGQPSAGGDATGTGEVAQEPASG
ncbi:MAG TPA: hypothetical protein VGD06_16920 [Acidobacteriota bacterium]|jgi:hypothetical protein